MNVNSSNGLRINIMLILILTLIPGMLFAQGINRTSWEMNRGGGWSYLNFSLPSHGYPGDWNGSAYNESTGAYANANIPDESDTGWGPAPNGETIGFSESSILPGNCLSSVDYTYFQTFVNVPTNTNVTQFNIVFSAIDDGGRITIFNNAYPGGVVVAGSYFTLSGGGTADLASYITTGQNRVVVTQVDDCPTGNNLQSATIVLNGETVETCSVGEPQTFTILGANGNIGDIDPYSQALPAGATEWQPAYLSGTHPWGLIAGTNSWVNYSPDNTVGLNTRTPYRIRFEVPEDFSDPSMVFQLKADNRAVMWINNTFIDSVDGGGTITPADATVESALQPGINEIRLLMVDWGGIVGFNYRIDVTMTSCEDITNAVLTPDEAAALNNAPTADAGPDQNSALASVTLDGSASSDPDENLLIYTWTENGSVIATGVTPTITLADGSHTITLTVSDGELSDTDQVIVNVHTNDPPVANAGADQTIDCVAGFADVTLDGSGSSDPDNDSLTYRWGLAGSAVSTDALYTTALGPGTHEFTLTVSDGQETHSDDVSITIVADTENPTLVLLGDNPANINVNNPYIDGGYTATDACDPDVAVSISGTVDHQTPGTYTLTYTATDDAGNQASAQRVVTVTNPAPVADAGADQTGDCEPTFNLDGSGSTDDGELTYSWILQNNLLVNGSFEDGMTGWAHTGVSGAGGNSIDRGSWGNATDGNWIIDLVGTGDYATPGHVEQSIGTDVGRKYVLSFDLVVNGAPSLVVTVDGGNPQTFSGTGSHATAFTATSASTTIRLSSDGSYQYVGNNLFLDNVSLDGEASTSASFTTTALAAGSYTYTLTVTDAFGATWPEPSRVLDRTRLPGGRQL